MSLERAFFARPAPVVAPELLGCRLTHGDVTVRLTEVEAYTGEGTDPGSHAFRGRTPRTEVMFGAAGHLYVYFSYGMHWCANVVCGDEGTAAAVLLRAGEVVEGHEVVATRRAGVPPRDWARGPARLTSTLAIDRAHDGADVCGEGAVRFEPPVEPVDLARIRTGPRVGVSGPGGDGTAYPYRFWLDGEPSVSASRPGVTRRRTR